MRTFCNALVPRTLLRVAHVVARPLRTPVIETQGALKGTERRFSQKTADFHRFTPFSWKSSIFGDRDRGGQNVPNARGGGELAPKVAPRRLGFLTPWKLKIFTPPLIFGDLPPPPPPFPVSNIWKAQETAENRRFAQETADWAPSP